jgi:hypothetical protein
MSSMGSPGYIGMTCRGFALGADPCQSRHSGVSLPVLLDFDACRQ